MSSCRSVFSLVLLGFACFALGGCAADEDAAFSRNAPELSNEDGAASTSTPTTETDPATATLAKSPVGETDTTNIEPFVPELAPPDLAGTIPVENVPSPAAPLSSFPKMAVRSPEKGAESRLAAPRMMAPMSIAPAAEESLAPASESTTDITPGNAIPRMAAVPAETLSADTSVEPRSLERASSPETATETPIAARTPVAEDRGDFEAVTVFYGTDRSSTAMSGEPDQPHQLWLSGAGVCLLLFGLFTIVALAGSRKKTFASLAVLSFSSGSVMAILGAIAWLQSGGAVAGPMLEYGNGRGKFVMGTCEVSIPGNHQVAELEAPSVFKLDFVEDPTKHVVLLDIQEKDSEGFFSQLRSRVEQGVSKDAFVFVHGFNVTFEDAARRTAQLAYDLKFQGAPIFYSWPSQGGLFQYAVDETNVVWTVPHLREFLKELASQSGAQSIHLIAHSMGNRALTSALRELSLEMQGKPPLFHEVVLTAPDIDREIFERDIAPAIVTTAKRVTLYASSNDEALVLSKQVHGYPRAGDTGERLVVIPGIETIDVSAVDTSLLGHNYYGDNATVISDMIDLVRNSKSANERSWLEAAHLDDLLYWVFRVDRTATGSAPPNAPSRY